MFEFLRIQYKLGKIGTDQLSEAVANGWITEEEAEQVLNEKQGNGI